MYQLVSISKTRRPMVSDATYWVCTARVQTRPNQTNANTSPSRYELRASGPRRDQNPSYYQYKTTLLFQRSVILPPEISPPTAVKKSNPCVNAMYMKDCERGTKTEQEDNERKGKKIQGKTDIESSVSASPKDGQDNPSLSVVIGLHSFSPFGYLEKS
ncbi:hypothetical protein ACRALDRAFT_205992 [Sodiomyces alcalophilus JCM 7366]|uniref:uncharacterized protein n=1 Tax=Sodiomyces alcalophilus JCM 7366 TaxID=591952 RepID=UPI0039B6BDDF